MPQPQENLWEREKAGTEPPAGGRPAVQTLRGSQGSLVCPSWGPWKCEVSLRLLRRKETVISPTSLERSSRAVGRKELSFPDIGDQAGGEGEEPWGSQDPGEGLPGICSLVGWGWGGVRVRGSGMGGIRLASQA